MLTNLSLVVNIVSTLLRILVQPFYEHESVHFDNGSNIHMGCENYKDSGYDLSLDLLIISY